MHRNSAGSDVVFTIYQIIFHTQSYITQSNGIFFVPYVTLPIIYAAVTIQPVVPQGSSINSSLPFSYAAGIKGVTFNCSKQ